MNPTARRTKLERRALRHAVPWAYVALAAIATASHPAPGDLAEIAPLDAAQVVTAEACGECHATAYQVLQKTRHATGFRTLHRQSNAAEIAERMDFRLIKRDSLCLDCHYTPIEKAGGERAASGVSCESCHGAGRGYLDVHNDFGGKGIDHNSESAEHRRQRIEASLVAGMRRPSDLYDVASSCFGCHTVPNEKLINVGRHSLGSADFELAAWSQGDIRHNFLDSFLDGDGTVNAQRPVEHRRRLLVIGRMLALEHALRGLAKATENGVYLKAMQRRLRRTTSDLRQLARGAGLEECERMVEIVRGVEARLGHQSELLTAADRVAELARAFLDRHDGTRLAAVDPLLVGEDLPFDDEQPIEAEAKVATAAGGSSSGTGGRGSTSPAVAQAAPASTSAGSARSSVPAVGDKRSHVRPRSRHATLEATACQKCHSDQNAWWFQDAHYASIEPFLDRGLDQSKVARLYGLSPSRIGRGSSLCMDCHGTVATGRARNEVLDGVSCQGCHGPAADYLEVHQAEEGESLSPQRPGFLKALQQGMNNLRDIEVAVRGCGSCHYVTDPRLISAGHTSGIDFDIVAAMPKIQHWQGAVLSADRLRRAWAAVLSERGAVPDVLLARLAGGAEPSETKGPASVQSRDSAGGAPARGASVGVPGDRPSRFEYRSRPAQASISRATSAAGSDLPKLGEDAAIEDVLRVLQRRLEQLYRTLGGPSRASGNDREGGRE